MDPIAIGTVLDGRYRVDAELGAGGMGRVYRCEQVDTGRSVAVKVLRAELGGNADAVRRFEREAMVSARLDHPNIVRVEASGVLDDGTCYLVMELLDGEPLAARIEHTERIAWRDAVDIIRQVVRGLGHAHLRDIVHRDIKPDNVFLCLDGAVKVLDFGIAKLCSAGDGAMTRNGITIGTPAYLSPEQAIGGAVTHASDLYSATVVLFEMLTGRTPFAGLHPVEMVFAHVSKPVPSLADIDVDVPLALVELVERGLEKRAMHRIASAADYIDALDAIAAAPRAASDAARSVASDPVSQLPTVAHRPCAVRPGSGSPTSSSELSTASAGSRTGSSEPQTSSSEPQTSSVSPRAIDAIGEAPTERVTYPGVSCDQPRARPAIAMTAAMRRPRLPTMRPVRRRWLPIATAMFAAAAIVGGLAGFASRSHREAEASTLPVATPAPIAPVAPIPEPPRAKAATLDEALHQLRRGKTCAERRDAIPRLVEIGDAYAVHTLKAARRRMRSGVNTNECLKADAEDAIRQLARVY